MIELSARLKDKTEFFCASCQTHKPIRVLGKIDVTSKSEKYQCIRCYERRSINVRIPSLSKLRGTRVTAILKDSVTVYMRSLNIKE